MRNIFSTLTLNWTVDLDPDGDGDLKPAQIKFTDLSEETRNLIKKDLKKITNPIEKPKEE